MDDKQVEKKLAMSLDELIAQQRAKQSSAKGPKPGGAKKAAKTTKGGGRVLVVPRPKHVPRPSSGGKAAAALGPRGGGVQKAAPKYAYSAPRPGSAGAPPSRQASNRNVKVTIGNKLSGRPAQHIPTSGVLSKPFMQAGSMRGSGGGGSGRAPLHLEPPVGGSLAARFDTMAGAKPANGPAPHAGGMRRNAHGVILP